MQRAFTFSLVRVLVQKIKQKTMKIATKSRKTFLLALAGITGITLASNLSVSRSAHSNTEEKWPFIYAVDSTGKIVDSMAYNNESFFTDNIKGNVQLAVKEKDGKLIPIYRWQSFNQPISRPAFPLSDKRKTVCSIEWVSQFHLPKSTIELAVAEYHQKIAREAQIVREKYEARAIDSFLRLSKTAKKDSWDRFAILVVDAGLSHCSAMIPYHPVLKGYYSNKIEKGLVLSDENRKYIAPFYFGSELAYREKFRNKVTISDGVDYRKVALSKSPSGISTSPSGVRPDVVRRYSEDRESSTSVITDDEITIPSVEPVESSKTEPTRIKELSRSSIAPLMREEIKTSKSVSDIKAGSSGASSSIAPGQITAGIWNDVDHWDAFQKTHQDPAVAGIAQRWGMQFDRQLIKLSDKNGKPLVDATVELYNQENKRLWICKTDNRGLAVLYLNFRGPLESNGSTYRGVAGAVGKPETSITAKSPVVTTSTIEADKGKLSEKGAKLNLVSGKLVVIYNEKVYERKNWKLSPNYAAEELQINQFETQINRIVDVCLVVDATGSMGDELHYLKSEMMDVMMRAQGASPCAKFRFSSVFYRDLGDAYVTKSTPFTDRVDDVISYVNEQSVGGGGDFPEAVDSALAVAVNGLQWSPQAITRILFLVLDAPAHDYAALRLRETIEKAARLGIKIIPIAASGIDKNSEFLFKYMATATYGDYLYITDHSGIGGSHLKPTGVKENKQYLNDLMVELIAKYSQYDGCDPQTPSQMQPRIELFGDQDIQIQAYPNPAISDLSIQSNLEIDAAEITTLDGRVVKLFEKIGQKSTYISVDGLTAGIYVLRCKFGNSEKVYTTKILVMPAGNNQGNQQHH